MSEHPELSVVCPLLNEEGNLPELYRRLTAVLQDLGLSYEIVFVDDGSTDGSVELLREIAEADPHVMVVVLSRNFGHQIALTAGVDHAGGDAIVVMDSDLQDPPELIPELVAGWRRGLDIVYAQRRARPGESLYKRGTAFVFYRFMRAVADIDIPADAGDFRLLSRKAADAFRTLRERNRFVRGLTAWLGFHQGAVVYDRPARRAGKSKYRTYEMVWLAATAAFSFSRFAVWLLGTAGLFVCLAAVVTWLLGASRLETAVFFLGGVQLLGLWVLGQYLATIAEEVRRRPLYVVRETVKPQPSSPSPKSAV